LYHGYIRIYRDVEQDNNIVETELRKLNEFIRYRSSMNKHLSYYIITYIDNGEVDGYIAVKGDEDRVKQELELINGFIESSLTTLKGRVIEKYSVKHSLPIPGVRNFY